MSHGPASNVSRDESTLRGLVGVFAILAALATLLVWWLMSASAPGTPAKPGASNARVTPPIARFADITASSGVRFQHENGARGEKLLPETMGGGVAVFDADGDGDPDLLFVNSCWWPGDPRWASTSRRPPTSALYRNDTVPGGTIHFTDITEGSGFDFPFYGMGAACGDFDNDGAVDVLLTGVGGEKLFRNLGGGRFKDVSREAGLGETPGHWSTAATWVDVDHDGDLDLYVGRYVRWSRDLDLEVNNQLPGVGRAYGRPWNFPGEVPRLLRNDGGRPGEIRFVDVSASSGLQVTNKATGQAAAKTLAVAPIDLNRDGWIDLVVANDTVQNFVFTNRHDGTFAEVGEMSGVAFDAFGQARGAMGIDVARFRNDDSVGIAIGNFANEMNALYVARPGGVGDPLVFTDEAVSQGIGPASQSLLKFGLFFFDYDLDGRLDVLTANGHIEDEIEKVQPGTRYRQPAQLFWNTGGQPAFVEVESRSAGDDLFRPMVGRGSAYGDLDGDGDLDVVITQVAGSPRILRNDQELGRRWIRVRLEGTRSNRDGIGAWVQARIGDRLLARQVMATRSYLSQSELTVTLGLGGESMAELLVVWPDGSRQVVDGVREGATVVVRQAGR
jgi:hypothetical protein